MPHKPLRLLHAALPLLCIGLLATACSDRKKDNRPVITVTVEPLRYVTEAVAGDKFRVETLMPQGASPETYEPTPRQMMELDGSVMVLRIGTLGFEQTRLPQMTAEMPDLKMVEAGKGIATLNDESHTHSPKDAFGGKDPHVWMSPDNLRTMARNVCDALCETDTLHADYYRLRLALFEGEANAADAEIRKTLSTVTHRTFLIYHPALGYFAHSYGLRQIAVERDGKEPSAAYLSELTGISRAEGVRIVFISKEHSGRAARRLAEETGARVVEINPLSYDVMEQMREIAKALAHE